MTHEYIVTVRNYEDLDSLYSDMEQSNALPFVPTRPVECANRRNLSRNTHYILSNEEAEELRKDHRVIGVERADVVLASIRPNYQQVGNFSKSATNNNGHLNWGLLRVTNGAQTTNWGTNGNAQNTGTIKLNTTGKDVDVIIFDGHFNPAHPEFAVNSTGTGGTRVVQLDWHQFTPLVSGIDDDSAATLTSTYIYTPYIDAINPGVTSENNHGASCAGVACGNNQGWARSANIYNLNPYSSNTNNLNQLVMWDYIRLFHRLKTINPRTKRKNPTVVNCSFGSALYYPYNYGAFQTGQIVYINYRGTDIGTPSSTFGLTDAELTSGGIYASGGIAEVPFYSTSFAADIQDALADGIHIVGAAGNSYSKVDIPGGVDYNNYFYDYNAGTYTTWYAHRGTAPGAVPGVICVGSAAELTVETKANYSNCGPRIDVFAPGTNIMSSVHTTGVADSRNASFNLAKRTGTSFAAPQVAGIVACLLEMFPTMTNSAMRQYIINTAKNNQLTDPAPSNQSNVLSLQGAANKYLFIGNFRLTVGQIWPRRYALRPVSGQLYPRSRRRF